MTPKGYGNGWRGVWQTALLLLGLLSPRPAEAQPLEWQNTPPELRGWIPWVLDTLGDEACPRVAERPVCTWPGLLQLELTGASGRFRMTVVADRRTLVELPGSPQAWPQNVAINGNGALVVDRDGAPSLLVGKGAHTIEGEFLWNELPETLKVPPSIALITLRRDRQVIEFPKRDPGLLWLRATSTASEEPQRLSLEVFRRLEDGVPFRVTTRLELRVSGKPREINLGRVSLPRSSALSIESAVPVRLNDDETLSAQVYAGNHSIEVVSLFADPPGALARQPHGEPWPQDETWVLAPDPALRQVELRGAVAIDPNRTNLPGPWRHLAAYAVAHDSAVELVTSQRGEPDSPPNRLQLTRDVWFDLNEGAYTIRDRFTGQVNRDWRLDLMQGQLDRVLLDGEAQLITHNPGSGLTGVELRKGQLSMVAEWRTKGNMREFPAVGWSEDVQELRTTVHVPPGWQLLSTSGVDSSSETWYSSWDLFSLFFVLVVSVAIGQLTHPSWGMLTLLTMVLTHGQPEAPRVLWAVLLAVIAVLRVLPDGFFRKLIQISALGTAGALLVTLVDYGATEIRTALYPQTEEAPWDPSFDSTAIALHASDMKEGGTGVRAAAEEAYDSSLGGFGATKRGAPAPEPAPPPSVQRQQDPQAVVQSGAGIPTWSWRSWSLSWSGPVHRDHQLSLVLLSRTGSAAISVLRLFLVGMLAFLLLRYGLHQLRHPPRPRNGKVSPAVAALLLSLTSAFTCLGFSNEARAEVPNAELLQELRERITRKPPCAPRCTSIQRMEVNIQSNQLQFISEVHVSDEGSIQLPGPYESWAPTNVKVTGKPAAGLVLAEDGFLHLRLPPGRHWVVVDGPVLGSSLTLTLGDKPRWVQVTAQDWDVDGVSESGAVDGSLRFHKHVETNDSDSGTARVSLPSWLLVTRTLKFGVTWSVSTHVERIGSASGPVVERYALLPGEQVTRADLVVENGHAVLSLARDQTTLEFESVLGIGERVNLVAASRGRISERWMVQCGPIWRCTTSGMAPSSHQSAGHWEPRYTPWPNDTLEISLVRPKAAPGQSLTLDRVDLNIHPGTRLLKATLTGSARASSRNVLTVTLPERAEVQELLLDGVARALQQRDGAVDIGLDPGAHEFSLSWQQPGGMETRFRSPEVKLSSPSTNVRVEVYLPEDRWLLGVLQGPPWGPAILLWGYVLFLVVVSMVLGWVPGSPLRSRQWILLGLGLTQVPAVVAVLIAGWFFAFVLLPNWRPRKPIGYNLAQIALVGLSVAFLVCLFGAVYDGLLSTPNMKVGGAGSSNNVLSWYVDRIEDTLPQPLTLTTPLWVWRALMLAWSLWLAFNLVRWLKWAFSMFSQDGLWLRLPKTPKPAVPGFPTHGFPGQGFPPPPGYPTGFTPTPTPVAYPGAQWVVRSEPPPSGEDEPSSRTSDKGPVTLPTGAGTPSTQGANAAPSDAAPSDPTDSRSDFDRAPDTPVALTGGTGSDSAEAAGAPPTDEPATGTANEDEASSPMRDGNATEPPESEPTLTSHDPSSKKD